MRFESDASEPRGLSPRHSLFRILRPINPPARLNCCFRSSRATPC